MSNFLQKRKLNDGGEVYYAQASEVFYNRRKYNKRASGQNFSIDLVGAEDLLRRELYFRKGVI